MDTKTEITREHWRDKIELAALWVIISIYNARSAIGASTWSFTSNDWEFHTSGNGIIAYIALVLSVFCVIKYLIEAIKRPIVDDVDEITIIDSAVAMDEPKPASGYKFKVGDRVKTNRKMKYLSIYVGEITIPKGSIGTILEEDDCPYVRMDVGIRGMHDCNNLCEYGNGWAICENDLDLVTNEEKLSNNT